MLGVSVVDVSTAPAIVQEKDEAEARFDLVGPAVRGRARRHEPRRLGRPVMLDALDRPLLHLRREAQPQAQASVPARARACVRACVSLCARACARARGPTDASRLWARATVRGVKEA